jgi:tRNA pseudouridine38-40 synthase
MAARPMALVLQYDGGAFAGWQRQPNVRTVQGDLEAAVARLAGRRVPAVGAGRTDAGVHALAQVAAVTMPDRWRPAELVRALNAVLPDDIWVDSARRMPPGFNPRRDALERTYCYRIGTDPGARSPFRRRWEWAVPPPVDVDALRRTAAALHGTHSFRALSAAGVEREHWRCQVSEVTWQRRVDAPGYELWITADRFLHRMVRFVVGLTMDIARGRRPFDDLSLVLGGADNSVASPPAPPHGLYLATVRYPAQLFEDGA